MSEFPFGMFGGGDPEEIQRQLAGFHLADQLGQFRHRFLEGGRRIHFLRHVV